MQKIRININDKVDSIKELDVRRIFEYDDRIEFVLNTRIAHELLAGQSVMLRRYLYRQNGSYYNLNYELTITDIGKYIDDNGIEYDMIETYKVPENKLTIKRDDVTEFTYYDLSGSTYFSSSTPTVSVLEYEYVDSDMFDPTITDVYGEHVCVTSVVRDGIKHVDVVYHQTNMIPPQYNFLESPYMSGWTETEDISHFIQTHPDEFPYFSGMTAGQTIDEYMEANPELFEFDEHTEMYIVTFNEYHDIFYQDIELCEITPGIKEYELKVLDINGAVIGYLNGLEPLHRISDITLGVDDFYTTTTEKTCGIFDEMGYPYDISFHNYHFLPSDVSMNRIAITDGRTNLVKSGITDTERTFRNRQIEYLLENGMYFVPIYNPYYYTNYENDNVNGVFWGDVLWDEYDILNNTNQQYDVWVNCGNTKSVLTLDESYYRVSMNELTSEAASSLDENDLQGYSNDVIDSLIPEIIDYERVKYIPIIHNGDNNQMITKINFNLHFRKRKQTIYGLYPIYESGWYIDSELASTVWWNEMEYNGGEFSSAAMMTFMSQQMDKSDLLGYLGFDDDDVYNQKSKIRNSFLRLSFYTSKDPIEQKLLYYSTIFLNSSDLFGKFVKEKVRRYENGITTEIPIVFSAETRLDTKITVTDEYNTDASSEGFNLYLFRDDVQETSSRTIYMKVEFNHAGYGKTIPMMVWPVDDFRGSYKPLTNDNYLESLYIPVVLRYLNGRYTYQIRDWDVSGDTATLTLFEPKLDALVVKKVE